MQILNEHDEEFLINMNSQAIAKKLRVIGLIPEAVEHEIQHSTSSEESNSFLLAHLKMEATRKQVLDILNVASEKTGYSGMEEFAGKILKRIRQGLCSKQFTIYYEGDSCLQLATAVAVDRRLITVHYAKPTNYTSIGVLGGCGTKPYEWQPVIASSLPAKMEKPQTAVSP